MRRARFPYDRFHYRPSANASEQPRIDDPLPEHPEPYLSDRIVSWALLVACCATALLILNGWI